ncbi:MAG: TRAP transporter substrate-binding protein DctP [Spirochaetaceae bacterium]|nr:MAG: TRAP transporter substrate-binding protein DctP [Spirochaetaceae bacterium]
MRKIFCLLCLFILLAESLSGQVIKLGSLAPEGSPWDKALRRIAADWNAASDGRIRVRVFPGGIAGDEPDMVRKIRINQLQAAAITGVGLGSIDENIFAVQLPFLIRTPDEMDYVMGRMGPTLNRMLEERGFTLIAWYLAGWAHLFSKTPVTTPRDAQRLKMQVDYSSPKIVQAWKQLGFQVIPVGSTEVLTALQSDLVESFMMPPLTAAAMQWFGPAKNMLDLPLAPLLSGIIVSERVWNSLPMELKPELYAIVERHLATLSEETAGLEEEALAIMLQNGLQIHPVSPGVEAEWRRVLGEGLDLITGKVVSVDILAEVNEILAEYRGR